jgi:hypothetical protein
MTSEILPEFWEDNFTLESLDSHPALGDEACVYVRRITVFQFCVTHVALEDNRTREFPL